MHQRESAFLNTFPNMFQEMCLICAIIFTFYPILTMVKQIQYKAALLVSGCWQGTSRERLYQELGWESLSDRRWCRRMTMFYKILNGMAPSYLRDHIPEQITPNVCLRNTIKTRPFSRTERYGNSFFTFCINNWNDIDNHIKSLPSLNEFKNKLFKFIRPKRNTFFNIRDNIGIKLLTKIRVSFSDLRDHRYDHNFNCENPLCSCGIEDETTTHFFLCCPLYYQLRITYLSKISEIVGSDVTVLST